MGVCCQSLLQENGLAVNAAVGSTLEGREMQRFRDGKQQGHVKTGSKSKAQLVCALSHLTAVAGKQAGLVTALCPRCALP